MFSVKEFQTTVMEVLPTSVRPDWKHVIVSRAGRFFENDIRLSELSPQTTTVRFLEGVYCASIAVLLHAMDKEQAQR